MKNGLVILNYNDWNRTKKLSETALETGAVDLSCIVDNCSTDCSYEEFNKLSGEKVAVIQSKSNGGYSAGNNRGLKYLIEECGVDIVMIANPDTSFYASCINKLMKAFETHPGYAALGPVMIDRNGRIADKPYIHIPGYFENLLLCFYTYNRLYERIHDYSIRDEEVQTVDALQGSFWAVRSDIIRKMGYLDEGTFLYYEELCFASKMRDMLPDHKSGIVTGAYYHHLNSASIDNSVSDLDKYRIYMKSKEYYAVNYQKCGTAGKLLIKAVIAVSIAEKCVQLFSYG